MEPIEMIEDPNIIKPEDMENDPKPEKSLEQQLAELKAQNAKLAREKDKASSEAANYKRQVLDSKSKAEQEAMKKAEQEQELKERLAELEKKDKINVLEKTYMASGYNEDLARQAAEAQYAGDTDTVITIQRAFLAEQEKKITAKLMKEMPSPIIGNGDRCTVSKDEFKQMKYLQRLEFKKEHPKEYAEYTAN